MGSILGVRRHESLRSRWPSRGKLRLLFMSMSKPNNVFSQLSCTARHINRPTCPIYHRETTSLMGSTRSEGAGYGRYCNAMWWGRGRRSHLFMTVGQVEVPLLLPPWLQRELLMEASALICGVLYKPTYLGSLFIMGMTAPMGSIRVKGDE